MLRNLLGFFQPQELAIPFLSKYESIDAKSTVKSVLKQLRSLEKH